MSKLQCPIQGQAPSKKGRYCAAHWGWCQDSGLARCYAACSGRLFKLRGRQDSGLAKHLFVPPAHTPYARQGILGREKRGKGLLSLMHALPSGAWCGG